MSTNNPTNDFGQILNIFSTKISTQCSKMFLIKWPLYF